MALDDVEPFDEWEEFVLFASHYFLLVAKHHSDSEFISLLPTEKTNLPVWSSDSVCKVRASTSSGVYPQKRFASIIHQKGDRPQLGHVSGLGPQTRTSTIDSYTLENEETSREIPDGVDSGRMTLPNSFEPRMCHTTTTIHPKTDRWLLAGGRKSPDQPLKDCWVLQDQRWQRVDDLPIALYRHCQTPVQVAPDNIPTSAVLVHGGKTLRNVISSKWFLWRDTAGWVEVLVDNADFTPRFGAVIASYEEGNGVLLGGMSQDGTICLDFWLWSILFNDEAGWRVKLTKQGICRDQSDPRSSEYIYRFGASIERTCDSFLLIGGVANEIIPECYEVIEISNVVSPFLSRIRFLSLNT